MDALILLVVIGTSIWVLVDAKSIGVKKGQITGLGNMGPWGWFFACLLLWIVGFPMYLIKRGEFKKANASSVGVQGVNGLEALEKLGELRAKAVITDEEFAKKKQQVLAQAVS